MGKNSTEFKTYLVALTMQRMQFVLRTVQLPALVRSLILFYPTVALFLLRTLPVPVKILLMFVHLLLLISTVFVLHSMGLRTASTNPTIVGSDVKCLVQRYPTGWLVHCMLFSSMGHYNLMVRNNS